MTQWLGFGVFTLSLQKPRFNLWLGNHPTCCQNMFRGPSQILHTLPVFMTFISRSAVRTQVLTVSIYNSPHASFEGRGEGIILNIPEHFVLLNKVCPREKLFNQSLTFWSFIRVQLTCGKKKLNSSFIESSCPTKGRKG